MTKLDNEEVSASPTVRVQQKLNWESYGVISAIVLSLISLILTLQADRQALRATAYSNLVAASQNQEAMLKETPEFFKMHGIPIEAIRQMGYTPEQVLYVLTETRADLMFYKADGVAGKEIPTVYRQIMFRNDDYRNIYTDILRCRMISPSIYGDLIDTYLAENWSWEPVPCEKVLKNPLTFIKEEKMD